jgi:hypothetical protein
MRNIILIVSIAVVAVIAVVGGISLWDYHEKPEFCSTFCHIMEPYVETWEDSTYGAHVHEEAGDTCLDCHEPTIGEQVKEVVTFVTKQYEEPLEIQHFPEEFCLKCHEHGSLEELKERTKDYVILGEVHNPHDPHPGVDESVVKHFECWTCHKMHQKSGGTEYCFTVCHHDRTFEVCSNCH